MSNELQTVSAVNIPVSTTPATFSQTGDKNTQVAHANQVIANTNIFLTNNGVNSIREQNEVINRLQAYLAVRSSMYYNLFVVNGETFDNGRFFVQADRALTESIDTGIKNRLAKLTDEAKAEIKTYPSLFMNEIDRRNLTQIAHYGFVTDIYVQGSDIRIEFQKLSELPLHSLNSIHQQLALEGRPHINELDRSHWTVKQVNLLEELRIAGINVFGII